MTARPSAPPSSATTGSNEVARGSPAIDVRPDVRQVGEHEVERLRRVLRQEVGLGEGDPVRHGVADRVLPGEPERIGRDVDREDLDGLERSQPPQARPPARPRSRRCPCRRPRSGSGGAPTGRGDRPEPAHDLGLGELHETLRLRPRDQGPGVRLEREPIELLDPAQVGDRLPRRPAREVRPIAARRIRSHRCLRVGQHDRPPDADRVPEEHLRIEPRRLGPGRGQQVRALAQQRPGRLDRRAPDRSRPVRRQCHRRRVGRPGRP